MMAFVLAVSGCKKNSNTAGPAGATGPSGPSLSGTLEGYVDLFDEYGTLLSPLDGVHITVAGKSHIDSTNAAGKYSISLTTGTYEIDLSKTGFGAMVIPSINFVGGGVQYVNTHIPLTQPASYSLSSITSATVAGGNVTFTVTPSNTDTKNRRVACFYSTNSAVSNDPATYSGVFFVNITAGNTSGIGTLQASAVNGVGIGSGSGTLVHVAAYPVAVNNNASAYSDIATGRNIYNNLNTASVVTTSFNFP
ncbi:MAG: hypothetical protein ACXVC6_08175 [Bacteroidia bacterium]